MIVSSSVTPIRNPANFSSSAGMKISALKNPSGSSVAIPVSHELIGKIKREIQKIEMSASAYDTAWVAMVRSSGSDGKTPQFPKCIDWILKNQKSDGSWGYHGHHFGPMKDSLSSTLACVIALKQWNLGESMRDKGIQFILSNWSAMSNENHCSRIGFDVTFVGMIKILMNMGLNLPLRQTELEKILRRRELDLKRASESKCEGAEAYLAFVSEGLDKFPIWEKLEKYQRKNGSILDSPSTTAATLAHHRNARCLEYLDSLLSNYEDSVPSWYSSDMAIRLYIVDLLEELGVAHHFTDEIDDTLNETHRLWLQNDGDIISNFATSTMAFRLLRMHGCGVSPALVSQIDEEHFKNSMYGYLQDTSAVLELYKASDLSFLGESFMKDVGNWTKDLLLEQENSLRRKEVEDALNVPSYASLQRIEHRRNIERLKNDQIPGSRMSLGLHDYLGQEIVSLAIEEFNSSQCIYQRELENLGRWFKENSLDQLPLPRQKLTFCYFSAAATLFLPEMTDARISWAQNGVLTTIIDDFFDVTGSREELINLIHLVDRWGESDDSDFCSDQVKIIYSALRSTIEEIGAKASAKQGYYVTSDIINVWHDLLRSFMREAEWTQGKVVPTLEEYMDNGYISFALGPIILPALFLIGSPVSPGTLVSPECHHLYRLVSTLGRLLNDIQGFEREKGEGKLNSVSLRVIETVGAITEDDAKEELRRMVERGRHELLEVVVMREKVNGVPRACKELFWNMSRVLHLFYYGGDGFSSPTKMLGAVRAVLHDPV